MKFKNEFQLRFYGLLKEKITYDNISIILIPYKNEADVIHMGNMKNGLTTDPSQPQRLTLEIEVDADNKHNACEIARRNVEVFLSWFAVLTDRVIFVEDTNFLLRIPSVCYEKYAILLNNNMPEDYIKILINIKNLDKGDRELYKRFVRSCSLYKRAVELLEVDPALTILCFVFALESLSKFALGKKQEKEDYVKVIKFFSRFYPIKEADWDFLKEMFDIRNRIVHEGAYVTEEEMKKWTEIGEGIMHSYGTKRENLSGKCHVLREKTRMLLIEFIRKYNDV